MMRTAPPLHTDNGGLQENDGAVHEDNGAIHKDDGAVQQNFKILLCTKTLTKT